MNNLIRPALLLALLSLMLFGCSSGGNNPIVPRDTGLGSDIDDIPSLSESDPLVSQREIIGSDPIQLALLDDTYHSLGVLGSYELFLNQNDMTAELIASRLLTIGESYIVDGASYFLIQPCSDCLSIRSIQLTSENKIQLNFEITHPFDKGITTLPPTARNRLDLDVFDVALIVVPTNVSPQPFPLTGVNAYTSMCYQPDGYTRELSNLLAGTYACPYFLVKDDSDSGSITNNRFEMGTKNLPFSAYFAQGGNFNLFLTMGYGASAKKPQRLSPTYYVPEFNRKNAWKVDVIPPQGENAPIYGNTWNSTDTTTNFNVTVKVWDWQQNSTVASTYPDPTHTDQILRSSRVSNVSVEILGMTSSLRSATTPLSGSGSPSDPLVYDISLANENGLGAGDYIGLVKVSDERVPAGTINTGDTDALVHTSDGVLLEWYSIPEFATYQVFTATVVVGATITVTEPIGGEEWFVGYPAMVKWTSTGPVEFVDIDLSLDGGATYTIPIASNANNNGLRSIPTVGLWTTTSAKIRITDVDRPYIYDESDANFTITCPLPAGPSNVQATDGIYYNKVILSWDPEPGASGYNIYRDTSLVKANHQTTSWEDTSVSMGTIYRYQVSTIDQCGEGPKSPADPGEPGNACVLPATPTNLTASDGTYTDRVALSWTAATGATTYNVYRNSTILQSGITGTTFDDMTAARGVIYTYEVESVNTCGPSLTKSTSNTGYAIGCSSDSDNTCATSTKTYLNSTVNGCVDQIDSDWYYFYTTPNGFTSSSKIQFSMASGTVDIYIYGLDPGEGSCPGTLLDSRSNVGATTIDLAASSKSRIYIRLVGNSGMVNYTMALNFIPTMTNFPIEFYVATTNGTSTGVWPTNGATPLTHATLMQMYQWANNAYNIHGYNLVWDETENFIASSYYTLNTSIEDQQMHNAYGKGTGKLSMYFVDALYNATTAYCYVFNPQSDHNVDNVFQVYSPNIWTWQNVIAHENGHGLGYLMDQYLYPMYSCPCGDNVCLAPYVGFTYLFVINNGCYAGNQMYYAYPAQPWDYFHFLPPQWDYYHVFHFNNPTNFPKF